MEKLRRFLEYMLYRLRSKTRQGIHSPFVYRLAEEVLYVNTTAPGQEKIEALRKKMLRTEEVIAVKDLGAGSRKGLSEKRKVSSIAAHSLLPSKYGQMLSRLVKFINAENVLELGTSLGITSLYLANANEKVRLVTIEGCPETAGVAQKNFRELKAENIELLTGNFDELLGNALEKAGRTDLVWIDGNHRKEPLLRYFRQCKKYIHNDSVIVLDDIRWSGEMQEAWQEIKKESDVTVTVDLFFTGLVFFRKEQAKEDFVLRF